MLKTPIPVKDAAIQKEARRVLARTLGDVPFFKVMRFGRNPPGQTGVDLLVTLRARNKSQRLVCRVAAIGQPRFAREGCLRLLHLAKGDDYPVFIAPYVSPGASAICTEMGVGFLDLVGNCRLIFEGVYVVRSAYPNPSVLRRELRSLYSPKAERVLRVLVTGGPRRWKTQELANTAQVSLGQIANVKKLLADREWSDADDTGFGLRPFDHAVLQLIKEWSENYRLKRSVSSDFYSMKPIPETESLLVMTANELGGDLGFTAFSGAARIQPVVRYQKVAAYYLGDTDNWPNAPG